MMQLTLNNTSTMRFPLNTSPTHGMVQWSPNFKPIFILILPRCRSVPMTPKDEHTHSFEFRKPNTSTHNPLNI